MASSQSLLFILDLDATTGQNFFLLKKNYILPNIISVGCLSNRWLRGLTAWKILRPSHFFPQSAYLYRPTSPDCCISMREFAKTLHFRSICCSSSEPGTNSKILSFQEAHWRDLSQTDVKVVKKVKSDGVPAVSLLPDGLPTLLVTLPHLLLPAQSLQPQGRTIIRTSLYLQNPVLASVYVYIWSDPADFCRVFVNLSLDDGFIGGGAVVNMEFYPFPGNPPLCPSSLSSSWRWLSPTP